MVRDPHPEKGEWIIESVPGDERMDAETFAAVQEGIADVLTGRLYMPEEVNAHIKESLIRRLNKTSR